MKRLQKLYLSGKKGKILVLGVVAYHYPIFIDNKANRIFVR